MTKSAHALVFCHLFSYTLSLVSLGEANLSFSNFYATELALYIEKQAGKFK